MILQKRVGFISRGEYIKMAVVDNTAGIQRIFQERGHHNNGIS